MKLGVSLYSYGADLHSRKMTVYDAIEHAAKIGCDGVEIVAEQHVPNWGNPNYADVKALGKFIESLGMEVANFSCYLLDFLRTDRRQSMEELKERAIQEIMLASIIGAKVTRPIYMNLTDVKGGDLNTSSTKEDLIEIISHCLPTLEEYDITWALEIHAPFPPQYYNEIIKALDSPHVGLMPDFSCWQTGGLPSEYQSNEISTFVDLLPYVVHVHGKGHEFNENGEEPNTPYKELLGALKDANYQGYVVAEYEGWWMNYKDSKTMVEKHFRLLEKYGR